MKKNYIKIVKGSAYKDFRNVLVKSSGTNLVPGKVDDMVKNIYETINTGQNECMDQLMRELKKKVDMIREI